MTQLRVELNRLVKRYLDDQVDADTLDRWVLERLQAILDSGDARAITLANAVDGGLVQLQEGAITKIELYEELRALVDRRPIFHIAEMEILEWLRSGRPDRLDDAEHCFGVCCISWVLLAVWTGHFQLSENIGQLTGALSLHLLVLSQVLRPLIHERPPPLEQVRAEVRGFGRVPNYVC